MSIGFEKTKGFFWQKNKAYIILFLIGWFIAFYGVVFRLDKGDVILYFSENRHDFLNYFFRFCTLMGEGYVYVVATIIFFFFDRKKSIAIIISSLLVLITSQGLKHFFQHHRPKRYFEEFVSSPTVVNYVPDVVLHDGYISSFPSGHTTSAFAFYTLLAFFIPHKGFKIFVLFIAVLVGISRMYLVQHFLKDVVAGSMLGFSMGMVTYWLVNRYYYILCGNKKI